MSIALGHPNQPISTNTLVVKGLMKIFVNKLSGVGLIYTINISQFVHAIN